MELVIRAALQTVPLVVYTAVISVTEAFTSTTIQAFASGALIPDARNVLKLTAATCASIHS